MILEAVKSIVEAEELSEKEIKRAEAEKAAVLSRAETDADEIRRKGAEQLKKYVAEKNAAALKAAEKTGGELTDIRRKQTDERMRAYAANVEKAVEAVLETIG